MGTDEFFISKIKNSTDIITKNNNTFTNLVAERRAQHKKLYFQRNDERWDVYNKRYLAIDPHFVSYGTSLEKDFIRQLNRTQNKVYERIAWLSNNIENLKTFTYESVVWNYVVVILFLDILPIVLFIWFIVSYKEKSDYSKLGTV